MLNRVILLLASLGMVLAAHLWVQKERGFDQGCWGVAGGAATNGCANAGLEKAGQLLGVPVAIWGYVFYFVMWLLTISRLLLSPRLTRGCYLLSEILAGIGFSFSLYLFYFQAWVAHAFCPLCLVSSTLVTVLFILHAIIYWRAEYPVITDTERPYELGYAYIVGFSSFVLFVALMLFVNQIGTRRLDQGENAKQIIAMVGQALPKYISEQKLMEMKPALYDGSQRPLKQEDWIFEDTPVMGDRRSKVKVIVFLDPNCRVVCMNLAQ